MKKIITTTLLLPLFFFSSCSIDWNNRIDDLDSDKKFLEKEVKRLEGVIQDLDSKIRKQTNELSDYEYRMSELEKQHETQKESITTLLEIVGQANKMYNALTDYTENINALYKNEITIQYSWDTLIREANTYYNLTK